MSIDIIFFKREFYINSVVIYYSIETLFIAFLDFYKLFYFMFLFLHCQQYFNSFSCQLLFYYMVFL